MKIIRFKTPRATSGIIDGYTVDFSLSYIENKNGFLKDIETYHVFRIHISRVALINWGFRNVMFNSDAIRIAFPFAVEFAYDKVKDGTLKDFEEFRITVSEGYDTYLYDLDKIKPEEIDGYEIKFENHVTTIDQKIETNKIADSIITCRDSINAIVHDKHKNILLKLTQERSLLHLFRSVNNEEEFKYAISALANLATDMNLELLKEITGENKKSELKSIGLLEKLLTSIDDESDIIIEPLRNINRIRQGFPTHSDLAGVIKSLKYFNINYPVEDYNEAWNILIENYKKLLTKLLEKMVKYCA